MRKTLILTVLILFTLFSANAVTYYGSDSLYIEGTVEYTVSFVTEAISGADNIDLSSSSVAKNDGVLGVQIGIWKVAVNSDGTPAVKLKVTASNFTCGSTALPYQLGIEYPYKSGSTITKSTCFVTNEGSGDVYWNPTGATEGVYTLPVGSAGVVNTNEMGLYFRLYDTPSTEGVYNGMVTFELTIN